MAELMANSRSRARCLELICADFLGEVGVESENPNLVLVAIWRLSAFLTDAQTQQLIDHLQEPRLQEFLWRSLGFDETMRQSPKNRGRAEG
jgi:hypothetical protein